MKKKIFVLIPLLAMTLVGCGKKGGGGNKPEPPEPNYYTVTFLNYDGTNLYLTEVLEGSTAVYEGPAPTRTASAQYEYVFTGWDHDLKNVTESFSTYAQYETKVRKYDVTFKNYDGTVLQTSKYEFGTLPEYKGLTPTRPTDAKAEYKFAGWDKTITMVTSDVVYTALFNASYAPSYRTPGLVYQIQGNNEYYAVVAYFGEDTNVAIPQVFDGVPVTCIREGAFSNNDKLENIFIPKTVTNIEPNAFINCPAITHLTVSEDNAIYFIDDNGDLATADTLIYTLPNHRGFFEVKDEYQFVYDGAFSNSGISTLKIGCDTFDTLPDLFAVQDINMPETLKSIIVKSGDIADNQFRNCRFIISVSLLESEEDKAVTRVGDYAFMGCESLDSLVFSNALEYIGEHAFDGCINLNRLQIGTDSDIKLRHIGQSAFANLPKLRYYDGYYVSYIGNPVANHLIAMGPTYQNTITEVNLEEDTIAINDEAFKDCPKLATLSLASNKLCYIGQKAFMNCVKLKNFNLHMNDDDNYLENLDYIPYNTFSGCSLLITAKTVKDNDSNKVFYIMKANSSTQLTIDQYVLGIDIDALSDRNSETTFNISCDSNNKTFIFEDNILKDIHGNLVAGNFFTQEHIVACEGEVIYQKAFYFQVIQALVFAETLKVIGNSAFHYAHYQGDKIYFPESLEKIGENAFCYFNNFANGSNEMYFYAKAGLTQIGKQAFYGSRSASLFTPIAEEDKPEGWVEGFDSLYSGKIKVVYSYEFVY